MGGRPMVAAERAARASALRKQLESLDVAGVDEVGGRSLLELALSLAG